MAQAATAGTRMGLDAGTRIAIGFPAIKGVQTKTGPRDRDTKARMGIHEQTLLAAALAGRGKSGAEGELAAAAWKELVALSLDRVRGWVASFRFPGHPDARIPESESDDAAQEAWLRGTKMLQGFRGADLKVFY